HVVAPAAQRLRQPRAQEARRPCHQHLHRHTSRCRQMLRVLYHTGVSLCPRNLTPGPSLLRWRGEPPTTYAEGIKRKRHHVDLTWEMTRWRTYTSVSAWEMAGGSPSPPQ